MNISTIISAIISILGVFIAGLVSYWVAVKQVKLGLDEHERRSRQKARHLVANVIEEFLKHFWSAAKEIAIIDLREQPGRICELNPHRLEIDSYMAKTKVFDRLVLAIDDLLAICDPGLSQGNSNKLQSIRTQVLFGSDETRSTTFAVWKISGDGSLLRDLRSE